VSNLKSAIASVMQQEGYIESFSMTGEKATKTLTLKLKYYDDKVFALAVPACAQAFFSSFLLTLITSNVKTFSVLAITTEGWISISI
jgi:hypothetical protein